MLICCAVAPCGHLHATSYPGRIGQIRLMRRELAGVLDGCPSADEIVLCASELAANAVQHSRSGGPAAGSPFASRSAGAIMYVLLSTMRGDPGPRRDPAWIAVGDSSSSPP